MSGHLTYLEAVVVGAMQGIAELFPVSSLGHSVLIPALVGGSWARDLNVAAPESPYLAFIVGLHVATALALLLFFWRDWVRIITGLFTSIRYRRLATADERLAWMIVIATIPVGLTGLLLEHPLRVLMGRPQPAAIFLALNGAILYAAERLRRRGADRVRQRELVAVAGDPVGIAGPLRASGGPDGGGLDSGGSGGGGLDSGVAPDRRIAARAFTATTLIGCAQVLALFAGISRSGVTMAAGLHKGLSHEDAARFAFLLATPVIFAAGVLKLPDLFGPLGAGIHGQILAGSIASFIGAYLSVRFLSRYFRARTLTPFAAYCLAAGVLSFIWLVAA